MSKQEGWKKRRMETQREPEKRRELAYGRVSTYYQDEAGNGTDMQKQSIAGYAGLNEIVIDEWLFDVDSGSEEERKELNRLREQVRADKVNRVLVYKLDRLSRDTYLYAQIEREFREHGVELVSVNEFFGKGPMAKFFRHLLAGMAELEKATIQLRLMGGKKSAMRKKGIYGGGPGCLGYRSTGHMSTDTHGNPIRVDGYGELVEVEEELETVRTIFSLRARKLSYGAIADYLNALGRPTRWEKRWHGYSVMKVIKREVFYRAQGVVHFNMAPEPECVAHRPALTEDYDLPERGRARVRLTLDGEEQAPYYARLPRGVPEGYRATIERALELHAQGMRPGTIARLLNDEGCTTAWGCTWRTIGAQRLLKNAARILAALDARARGEKTPECGTHGCQRPGRDLHEAEIKAALIARALYATGDWSYAKIAVHLDDTLPHPRNTHWFGADVRNMVIGRFRYKHLPAVAEPDNKE
jgi:DNA invertase Pin-like site-specific DNA recombinase